LRQKTQQCSAAGTDEWENISHLPSFSHTYSLHKCIAWLKSSVRHASLFLVKLTWRPFGVSLTSGVQKPHEKILPDGLVPSDHAGEGLTPE